MRIVVQRVKTPLPEPIVLGEVVGLEDGMAWGWVTGVLRPVDDDLGGVFLEVTIPD